ncbi:MAG: DUF4928 family protein [Planctomycetia bacterium]|nr:DUF4928 family protein [Planctomycetia bacterium]
MNERLLNLIETRMKKGDKYVPARLQAALALLERVRECPTLDLDEHMHQGSSGLQSHEKYGDIALDRLRLRAENSTHGRRSSNLREWGPDVLALLGDCGFQSATAVERNSLIDEAQEMFGRALRTILEQDPLEVSIRRRSAEAVIAEILQKAEEKGKTGDVAQYLVAAKLMIRLGREVPVHGANRGDRRSRSDPDQRLGDIEVGNSIIEVAVGLPDDKHLEQVERALGEPDAEVWLLTRNDRVQIWKSELEKILGIEMRRVVVSSVERFVGQNVTEIGEFTAEGRAAQLRELFNLYNERWVAQVGTPGIRILVK